MTIGSRLKEERKRIRLNQTDFAALAGVQISAQTNYENDKRQPDAKYLAAIAAAGADVSYITTGVRKGKEHMTAAAQTMRVSVLASLLGNELHQAKTSLPYEVFYAVLTGLMQRYGDAPDFDVDVAKAEIRTTLGATR